MKKKLKIGLDFDGVVAYNPFRIIRAPISAVKKKIFKKRGLKFFVPKNEFQIWIWKVMHESSMFPAKGTDLLKELVASNQIEVYLITARYKCLNQNLDRWLVRHNLKGVFKSIHVNVNDEQPHKFKHRIIEEKKCDYYVEDNLDIVRYLDENSTVSVGWVFNMIDRHFFSRKGFANLEQALNWIKNERL